MTTQSAAFLNSCLKVPIDPCNNCPAPVYNRPKMYLGRRQQSQTTIATLPDGETKRRDTPNVGTVENESIDSWSNAGIRSLAKFYDSIPDYCEVNHLSEVDFYSTLESLRTTSRELRTQSTLLDTCTTNSTTSLATYCGLDKLKTTKKKRQGSGKSTNKKKISNQRKSLNLPITCNKLNPRCVTTTTTTTTVTDDYTKCLSGLSRLNNFKEEFAAEVADFKRTLKTYEEEFNRPSASRPTSGRSKSGCNTAKVIKVKQKPIEEYETTKKINKPAEEVVEPQQNKAKESMPPCKGESLRKCFSVNDMTSLLVDSPPLKPKDFIATAAKTHIYPTEMSKYFLPKRPPGAANELPKITIDSPATTSLSSKRSSSASCTRRRKTKNKKCSPDEKLPFTIFQLDSPKRQPSCDIPMPVHPVARPNLAATLRAEVARRKVKEVKNNCTYRDTTPHVDWEVRKTPAWKSLALNEPHKTILSIRLATRKAEQALQQRQYELQMELMRQRVKSAPLLLEGDTFWGPDVGKLSHTCQHEGVGHTCGDRKQRKHRKKGCGQHSSRCTTADNMSHISAGGDSKGAGACIDFHKATEMSKNQQLRKIYGGSAKANSRNSLRSTACGKRGTRSRHNAETAASSPPPLDSGDELCSVDRAFL